MKLDQRKLLMSKSFEIVANGLQVKYQSPQHKIEFFVPFEDVGNQTITQTSSKYFWLPLSGVFFIIFALIFFMRIMGQEAEIGAELFYMVISIVCLFGFFLSRKTFVYLSGNQSLEFFRSKPSAKEVDEFIEEVISARKKYLKNKYAKPDPDLPFETQVYNFRRMFETDVISEKEFEQLKQDLKTSSGCEQKEAGFNH